MSIYKPTWLYIKQHNQTGLKYFGKTWRKDPYSYKGSGKYWTKHIKKHGNDVTTIWCQLFLDDQSLIEYAVTFSKENNIVDSKEWANLIIENGHGGGAPGEANGFYKKKHSDETRLKMSDARKKQIITEEQKKKNK